MRAQSPKVAILDVYNEDIYPHDEEAKAYISTPLPISSYTGDQEYLTLVEPYVTKSKILTTSINNHA